MSRFKLDLTALEGKPRKHRALMALDFGTAFSKASVILDRDGSEVRILPLGRIAARASFQAQDNPYLLHSSVFVSDGRFLFGPRAYAESLAAPSSRARFDSPKTLFNTDDFERIGMAPVPEEIVPGPIRFRHLELVLLYLAFLTATASEALEAAGLPRHLPRRYAVPGWTGKRPATYAEDMRIMLASAQVLADTFRGRWHTGLALAEARAALDTLFEIEDELPLDLVAEGLDEATAAGVSIFNPAWRSPKIFMIVDVGAGTADLAAFLVYKHSSLPFKSRFRIAQLEGTSRGYDKAGNALDRQLAHLALGKAGIWPGDPRRRAAERSVLRQVREAKEALFRPPFLVEIAATRDDAAAVSLKELLESPEVRTMADGLRQVFREAVEAIGANPFLRYGNELHVYLTGGGASLPFVTALTEESIVVAGRKLNIIRHLEPPDWIGKSGAEWVRYFSQLAVVIGAPLPGIPEGVGPYVPKALKPAAASTAASGRSKGLR
jgi:molecular chaperone HscA